MLVNPVIPHNNHIPVQVIRKQGVILSKGVILPKGGTPHQGATLPPEAILPVVIPGPQHQAFNLLILEEAILTTSQVKLHLSLVTPVRFEFNSELGIEFGHLQ